MILVDSSVWIAYLRGQDIAVVHRLRSAIPPGQILVGDLILLEVLRGMRSETEAEALRLFMRSFRAAPICGIAIATKAAANYRSLRRRGITIRAAVDVIIATFCIERGHVLLQHDRDFLPMAVHLGLTLA